MGNLWICASVTVKTVENGQVESDPAVVNCVYIHTNAIEKDINEFILPRSMG